MYPRRKKGSKTRRVRMVIDITEPEFEKILEVTPSKRHRVGFVMAFCSGLRVSEVINLEPRDFDFENGKLKVRNGKGGKDRIICLPKHFEEYHMEYIPMPCKQRALQKAFITYAIEAGIVA